MRIRVSRLVGFTFAAVCLVGVASQEALAGPVTIAFNPGQYDNTLNTVLSGGVLDNNQTTGLFRDVFWFSTRNPVGPNSAEVGSADFINSGLNLISSGGSPAHAFPGGTINALNFTGDAPSGGQSYLTVYDTTPGDGTATKDTFSATGGLSISADILFTPGQHTACGGVTTLYSEGQDGLSLLACNGGGNNNDVPKLDLVFKAAGPANVSNSPIILSSVVLPYTSFVGNQWYNVRLDLTVSGDAWTAAGFFTSHVTPGDPNSGLGGLITQINFTGSLSNPDASTRVLTNPGEIGIMALTMEGFSDGGCPPSAFPNQAACNDNVGVSVTNFTFPGLTAQQQQVPVPEPASMLLLGTGLLAAKRFRRRKN